MEIKIKLNDALNIGYALKEIAEKSENMSLKFKLLGLIHMFNPIVENYENVKNDLIIKYGNKNEDGSVSVDPNSENAKIVVEENIKILDTDITLHIDKLKLADINDFDINTLSILYPIIEE